MFMLNNVCNLSSSFISVTQNEQQILKRVEIKKTHFDSSDI